MSETDPLLLVCTPVGGVIGYSLVFFREDRRRFGLYMAGALVVWAAIIFRLAMLEGN
jgi:hypothetical protein